LGRARHGRIAAAKPEEGRGHEPRRQQYNQQSGQHLARRPAARLVRVLDSLKPRQLAVIIGRALVAHRSTAFFAPGSPTTAQLKWICSIRLHSTSEWAGEVWPIWKR